LAIMEENLTDRTSVYWGTLEEGELVNADQMFDAARRTKDLGEDIKYVRSFLDGEVNKGRAILMPGQSPPTYRKFTHWTSITDVCTTVFNSIPDNEEMTIVTFTNKLPQIFRHKKNKISVGSFLYRAKLAGAIENIPDADGGSTYEGRFIKIRKQKNIEGILPNRGKVRQAAIQTAADPDITPDKPLSILPEDMAKSIFDMKASEVGMSIFDLLHKLMIENEKQTETIIAMKDLYQIAMDENKRLVEDCNANILENDELKSKLAEKTPGEKTYGDLYNKS
jgi:hypothetical protein